MQVTINCVLEKYLVIPNKSASKIRSALKFTVRFYESNAYPMTAVIEDAVNIRIKLSSYNAR